MTWLKKVQSIESKALEKSILTKMDGRFEAAMWLRISRVAMKFSAINRPFINAVWLGLIKVSRMGLSRLANSLDMILGSRLMMLIGLKSVTNSAFCFFLDHDDICTVLVFEVNLVIEKGSYDSHDILSNSRPI